MTQQGTIKKILPGGMAEIEVMRHSACSHDCSKCGGCGGLESQMLYVTARNRAQAEVGERVLIEGKSGRVLGLAALAYVLPLILFFVGYVLGSVLLPSAAAGAIGGGLLFIIGVLAAVWYSRRMKARGHVPYEITKKL